MFSDAYLEVLRQREIVKSARTAINTAAGLALDALESSDAGLKFGGELAQLLRNPDTQEPDEGHLSFRLGDHVVDIIIADQALVPQKTKLRDLGNGDGGAEVIKHGGSPMVKVRHIITIVMDVEP